MVGYLFFCFFFSSRRRHTRCSRDWSSDVCSSDLRSLTSRAEYEGVTEVDERLVKDLIAACRAVEKAVGALPPLPRSEERRVGKECGSRWSRAQIKKKHTTANVAASMLSSRILQPS